MISYSDSPSVFILSLPIVSLLQETAFVLHAVFCKPCWYSKCTLRVAMTRHFRQNEGNYGNPRDGWHCLAQGRTKANPHQLEVGLCPGKSTWGGKQCWTAGCRLPRTAIRPKGTLLCLLFLCHKTKRSWSNNSLTTSLVFCFVFLQPFLLLCFFGFLIWFIDLSAVMIIDLVLAICSGVDTIGELNKTGPY